MKKLFIISIILLTNSSLAHAGTSGNYLGASLINTTLQNPSIHGSEPKYTNDKAYAMKMSLGASYGYAFNWNNFFLMPEVFYDDNDITNSSSGSLTSRYKIDNSYGVKLKIGYDFTDRFSGFLLLGHAESRVMDKVEYNFVYYDTNESFIFGLGFRSELAYDFSVGGSYQIHQFEKSDDIFNTTDEVGRTFDVLRVSLFYNF